MAQPLWGRIKVRTPKERKAVTARPFDRAKARIASSAQIYYYYYLLSRTRGEGGIAKSYVLIKGPKGPLRIFNLLQIPTTIKAQPILVGETVYFTWPLYISNETTSLKTYQGHLSLHSTHLSLTILIFLWLVWISPGLVTDQFFCWLFEIKI